MFKSLFVLVEFSVYLSSFEYILNYIFVSNFLSHLVCSISEVNTMPILYWGEYGAIFSQSDWSKINQSELSMYHHLFP